MRRCVLSQAPLRSHTDLAGVWLAVHTDTCDQLFHCRYTMPGGQLKGKYSASITSLGQPVVTSYLHPSILSSITHQVSLRTSETAQRRAMPSAPGAHGMPDTGPPAHMHGGAAWYL